MTAVDVETATTDGPDTPRRSRAPRSDSLLIPLVGSAGAIGVWFLLTELIFGHRPLVREFSPARTWAGVSELWESGVLLDDASASVMRLAGGLAIAVVIGLGAGLAMGTVRWLDRAAQPAVGFLRMVSPLSWAPLVIVLVGIGDMPVITLVTVTTVWPILMATSAAVRAVNPGHRAVSRALGATRTEVLRTVVVPTVRPHVLTGIRSAVALGWVVLVPAEMLGVTSGLGYQILNAKDQLAYHHITALIVVIGVLGLAIDVLARWILRTPRQRREESVG